jgi:hypothetical protein
MREIRTWRVTAINRHSGSEIVVGDFYSVKEAAEFVAAERPAADWRHVKILSRQKHSRD